MIEIPGTGITLPSYTVPQLLTLLGFIVADVLFAVAHALKTSTFEWRKLLEFYEKKFVPLFIGWFAIRILSFVVDPSQAGEFAQYATESAVQLAFARCIWLVGASVLENMRDLYGEFLPASKGNFRGEA